MILYLTFLFILFVAPIIWYNYIFKKNDKVLINMPFTGFEFGRELLQEHNLNDVQIEGTKLGDHYDLINKKVMVLDDRLGKKSLTSITIICHEIAHAIQHKENYKPLKRRNVIIRNTSWITQLGSGILLIGFPIIFATGSYGFIKICLAIAAFSLLISALIHIITLDVEIDASFNKAYPIIKQKVPAEYHEACRSILLAAALTYVIGVFRSFFSLRFIWLLITRMR
jgi:Zn-dependent membrane protease YugP